MSVNIPISSDETAEAKEKLSAAASQFKSKVSTFGQTAAEKIDEGRDAAASGLESAASALQDKAADLPGGEKISGLAHNAADKLNSSAEYVREHDIGSMMKDVKRAVKNNPVQSLVVAAVIGFFAGRTFSNGA